MTLAVTDGALQLNSVSGVGATKLDWATLTTPTGASHNSLTCDPMPAADEVVQATQRPSGEITGSAATAPSTISAAVRIPAVSLSSPTRTILAPPCFP